MLGLLSAGNVKADVGWAAN